jgi:hypothetical protein
MTNEFKRGKVAGCELRVNTLRLTIEIRLEAIHKVISGASGSGAAPEGLLPRRESLRLRESVNEKGRLLGLQYCNLGRDKRRLVSGDKICSLLRN